MHFKLVNMVSIDQDLMSIEQCSCSVR